MTLRSMSHRASLKVVSFDATLETLANGGSRYINQIPFFEELLKNEPLVRLKPINRLQPKLLQVAQGDDPGLVEVTHLGLGELSFSNPPITDLDGIVAVGGLSLDLGDNVALSKTHNGDGDNSTIGLEETHHTQFGTHDTDTSLHGH